MELWRPLEEEWGNSATKESTGELAQGVTGVSKKLAMNGGVKHFDLLFLCEKCYICNVWLIDCLFE